MSFLATVKEASLSYRCLAYKPMVVRFDTSLSISLSLLSVRSWGEERSEERSECRSLMTDYISLTPGGKFKKKRNRG